MQITDYLQIQKYVAFLDVLGFKELVHQKGEKLDLYFTIIDEAIEAIRKDKPEIQSQIVSDSIIIACDISDHNLGLLFTAVQSIQSKCAMQNIWIRGAITEGDIYFNQNPNIVVGNGLTQAYLMESQAIYPRVIINPLIIQRFKTREKFIEKYNTSKATLIFQPHYSSNFIAQDAIFIAFLEKILDHNLSDTLEILFNYIKSELYSGQQHYQKYLWLKNYFTEALSIMRDRYGAPKILFKQQPPHEYWVCESYIQRFQSL